MPQEMIPSHCPYCGSKLGKKFQEGRERLHCSNCERFIWKNASPVAVVIVRRGEKFLFVKRGIEPGKGKWSIPAGFLEYEETAEEAAIRELEEETGITAEQDDLEFLTTMNIERFPDQRLLANVFTLRSEDTRGQISAGSDAEEAGYWSLEDFENGEKEVRDQFLPVLKKLND